MKLYLCFIGYNAEFSEVDFYFSRVTSTNEEGHPEWDAYTNYFWFARSPQNKMAFFTNKHSSKRVDVV